MKVVIYYNMFETIVTTPEKERELIETVFDGKVPEEEEFGRQEVEFDTYMVFGISAPQLTWQTN